MSMIQPSYTAAERRRYRIYAALLFARYVQRRREDLGLSVEEAAWMSGMEVSEWCAIEGGWVPEDRALLRSIGQTLEANDTTISLYAAVARHNQLRF